MHYDICVKICLKTYLFNLVGNHYSYTIAEKVDCKNKEHVWKKE